MPRRSGCSLRHQQLVRASRLRRHVWAKPDFYDGLDELEEEEEVEEETEPEPEVFDDLEIGEGLEELERRYEEYRATKEEPVFEDKQRERLLAALKEDVPRCPDVHTVTWVARVMEEMAVDDDDVYEVIGEILTARQDELDTQALVDAVVSFGKLYHVDYDLLDVFTTAVRRQLGDFTNVEIAKLSSAFLRMGAASDTKYAGLFFEMRQRVNLPAADDYIKQSMVRDGQVYGANKEDTLIALDVVDHLPNNEKLKKILRRMLKSDTSKGRLLESSLCRDALQPTLDLAEDIKALRPPEER